jgi:hypothetical protein
MNLSERITWPVVGLFAVFAASGAYTIVRLPEEAQLALAQHPLSMASALVALITGVLGFFRAEMVKPKTIVPPANQSMVPPSVGRIPSAPPLPSEYTSARPSMSPKGDT